MNNMVMPNGTGGLRHISGMKSSYMDRWHGTQVACSDHSKLMAMHFVISANAF